MQRSPSFLSGRRRRGVAAVEFAVVLPFLCFALVATLDFCRIFYSSLTVSNCARNGALYGSANWAQALDSGGIQASARADASYNLDPGQLSVGSSTGPGVTYVDVTVTYPFTTIIAYPGIPRQMNLSRTVRMSVVPATPVFR